MFYSKLNFNRISIWQHLSVILSIIITFSTIIVVLLQSIDIECSLFTYNSFMFEFLDRYCKIFSLLLFDFPIMVSSMIPESLGFNIAVTAVSVLVCVFLGLTAIYFYKPKAKRWLLLWSIILGLELLVCFFMMFSDVVFLFAFITRAILLFCMIMSLRYVNKNYEYYDM